MWKRVVFCMLLSWLYHQQAIADVVPGGIARGSYLLPLDLYDSIATEIEVEIEPTGGEAYFWASQYYLENPAEDTHVGYMGMQVDGTNAEKRFIFSIWDVFEGEPATGAIGVIFGGEGVGYSIRMPYQWEEGNQYNLNLSKNGTWKNLLLQM